MSVKKNSKIEKIREQIKQFPTTPGLYFMKDAKDTVLYIGKAKNLRSRAASYFQPATDLTVSRGPKITEMISKVENVDFLETENEIEAILKEARLIKDIRPAYNTDMVDDKTFPYLEITTAEDFPGIYVTRNPRKKGVRLFGPFAGAKDLSDTYQVLLSEGDNTKQLDDIKALIARSGGVAVFVFRQKEAEMKYLELEI